MPNIEWNRIWAYRLRGFLRGVIPGKYYGDQWGDPMETPSLKEVRNRFITPYVNIDVTAMEIGSGGGRWTQFILDCKHLFCVDLSTEMFDYLRTRFPEYNNISFCLTNGTDLPGVPLNEIDYIFSFGTIVHLDLNIIDNYLYSIHKTMKEGGIIVLQFSDKRKPMAQSIKAFSDNDPERMQELFTKHSFSVEIVNDDLLPHSAIILGRKL